MRIETHRLPTRWLAIVATLVIALALSACSNGENAVHGRGRPPQVPAATAPQGALSPPHGRRGQRHRAGFPSPPAATAASGTPPAGAGGTATPAQPGGPGRRNHGIRPGTRSRCRKRTSVNRLNRSAYKTSSARKTWRYSCGPRKAGSTTTRNTGSQRRYSVV